MSGLLIKQALVLESNRPDCEDIKRPAVGVIFLGTPHEGTNVAGYGVFIAKVKQNETSLVESLKPTDQGLFDLIVDFARGYPNLRQVCFYDKVSSDYAGRLGRMIGGLAKITTVDRRSGGREWADDDILAEDHSGLNNP